MKNYNIFSEMIPNEEKEKFESLVAGERAILDASELLHKVLELEGINQTQLAKRLGLTKGYVSRLLSGQENLSVKNVAMVLHALGYSYKQEIIPLKGHTKKEFEGENAVQTEIVDIKILDAKRAKQLPYKIA